MNRNRGNDGGGTERRAGSEVIYVGRSSFWVERDIDLFQELPESPWLVTEVAGAGEGDADAESGVVAPVSSGVSGGILMGINLSGPIILQSGSDETPRRAGFEAVSRREDSHGTPLPAGEVTLQRTPRVSRAAFPSPLVSLMIVTVVAFSLGLVVSPLGDGPVLRHSGARTTLPAQTVPMVAATPRRSDDRFRGTMVPLIVPTAPSRAESSVSAGRAPRAVSKSERIGLKLALKKQAAGRKRSTPASPASAHASTNSASEVLVEDDQRPTRPFMEKESIDATKTAAPGDGEKKPASKSREPASKSREPAAKSRELAAKPRELAAKPWEPAAKPWVDPWAD